MSKNSYKVINIVTDIDAKKKKHAEELAKLQSDLEAAETNIAKLEQENKDLLKEVAGEQKLGNMANDVMELITTHLQGGPQLSPEGNQLLETLKGTISNLATEAEAARAKRLQDEADAKAKAGAAAAAATATAASGGSAPTKEENKDKADAVMGIIDDDRLAKALEDSGLGTKREGDEEFQGKLKKLRTQLGLKEPIQ